MSVKLVTTIPLEPTEEMLEFLCSTYQIWGNMPKDPTLSSVMRSQWATMVNHIKQQNLQNCQSWPRCGCIIQGKEGVDCHENTNDETSHHVFIYRWVFCILLVWRICR